MTKYLRALPILVLALLFGANVYAQALPSQPSPWPHVPAQNGNTWTYGTGSATAANAGSVNFPPPANGPVYSDSTINQPVGGGKSVPVTVRARPAPADIARAIGRFLGKTLPIITTAYAAYQLCQELGYSCGADPQGNPLVTGTQTSQRFCSYTPNYNCGEAANGAQFLEQRGCTGIAWNGWQYACGYPFYTGADAQGPATTTTTPKTLQDLENEIASKSGWPSNSKIGDALKEAIAAGEPLPLPKPISITGPASVPEAPTVTEYPDGSKVTDQRSREVAYGPDSVTVTDKSVKTETAPNGVTTPVSTTTTTQPLPTPSSTQPAPQPEPAKDPCGLPDTPACIVDGSGAPTAEELPDDGAKKALNPVDDFLKNPFSLVPELPTINWAFALPTACGNIPTPAFAPYLTGVDVCQFQPMFHELMSMVWMLGGLFGAISLFMRSSLAD